MGVIESVVDFRALSIRDLLVAREQYHWQLTNKKHVVGTAVGSYLIRRTDPWPDEANPVVPRGTGTKGARTLENSEVRPYSWPCVLVFVDTWVREVDGALKPQDVVPKTLYLSDGRMVPVCIVLAEPDAPRGDLSASTAWPEARAGGGFPLISRSQELERFASVGCLVSDGHTLYALTNRHVCGDPGTRVWARRGSRVAEVGSSSAHQITRRRFDKVYPTLAGANTYLNLDVGLIEVDDANDWTASFYGVGAVGELADLNEGNISLQLIDRPAVAYGAASGSMRGVVKALFYRYKSLGGYDYVADLLIAPAPGSPSTRPGDSGTVWHLELTDPASGDDAAVTRHPLGIEWGGQTFRGAGTGFNYALVTNLATACRILDVEVVLNHNVAAQVYWGATGHYAIGRLAIDALGTAKLGPFLRKNAALITFDRERIAADARDAKAAAKAKAKKDAAAGIETVPVPTLSEALAALADDPDRAGKAPYVPLADVPDKVWKQLSPGISTHTGKPYGVVGGRDRGSAKPEHPTHYADIDEEFAYRPDPQQPAVRTTIRALCMDDPSLVTVAAWQQCYDQSGHQKQADRGCLPFRVWQFYDELVRFAAAGMYVEFLTAAGILAHYVGDACQPLHGSEWADGDPAPVAKGVARAGEGVHSAYEGKMVDRFADQLLARVTALMGTAPTLPPITSGQDAAVAVVALMDRTAQAIPPKDLVQTYIGLGGGERVQVIEGLWDAYGDPTAEVIADGTFVLMHIWASAWRAGGGTKAPTAALGPVDPEAVIALYADPSFLPSLDLDGLRTICT